MTVSFYGSALSVLSHPTPEQETAVSNRSRDASQKSTQSRDSKFSAGEFFTGGGLKGRGLNGERNIWDTGGGSRCRKHKIHEGIILFTGWVVFHAGEIYGKMEQRS